MSEITIQEETGHGMFTELYRSAGLDIGEDWINTCHPVWSAAARRGGALLGAATVSCRSGRLVLEYLAVVPEARAHGLGRKLTALCLEYTAEAGAEDLWIAAREPGFYRKLGAAHFKYFEDDFHGTKTRSEKLLWETLPEGKEKGEETHV